MIAAQWLPSLSAATVDAFLGERTDQEAGHLLAFLPEAESAAVPMLQERCRQAGVTLAGATFPALLVDERLADHGAVLVRVSATAAPPPRLIPAAADVDAATRTLADYVNGALAPDDTAALLCIFDAMVPNIGSHLDSWYLTLANRVRYMGVNAGNERFTPAPCLFDGERFIGDGILAQLLPNHPGAAVQHGFPTPENLITATSAEGNRIVQIDWQPALEVYSALIRERHGIIVTRETFYQHAIQFPFGIVRADGEMLVRIPVALAEDDSIVCVGEIPSNSILALLDARNDLMPVPAGLAEDLAERAPERRGGNLLVFYCAGRRLYMGERMHHELADIARRTAAPHLLGALSLGEIGGARSGGYPLFHNAAVVAVPCRNR
jgi:hypothetical protein